jgi:hypothetical protein
MHSAHSLVRSAWSVGGFRVLLNPRLTDGYAIAEFAIVLPALIATAAIGMWSINLCVQQVEMQGAVSTISRTAARGDDVRELILAAGSRGISVAVTQQDSLVTVKATQQIGIPFPAFHDVLRLTSIMTSSLEGTNDE